MSIFESSIDLDSFDSRLHAVSTRRHNLPDYWTSIKCHYIKKSTIYAIKLSNGRNWAKWTAFDWWMWNHHHLVSGNGRNMLNRTFRSEKTFSEHEDYWRHYWKGIFRTSTTGRWNAWAIFLGVWICKEPKLTETRFGTSTLKTFMHLAYSNYAEKTTALLHVDNISPVDCS